MNATECCHRNNGLPTLILLLGIIAATAFAVLRVVADAPGRVQEGTLEVPGVGSIELNASHPFLAHSASDVNWVRGCLRDNGTYRVYREKSGSGFRWHLFCLDPLTGSFLDMVVEVINGKRTEITSFPVKDGTKVWAEVENWLIRKGATRWTSPMP